MVKIVFCVCVCACEHAHARACMCVVGGRIVGDGRDRGSGERNGKPVYGSAE